MYICNAPEGFDVGIEKAKVRQEALEIVKKHGLPEEGQPIHIGPTLWFPCNGTMQTGMWCRGCHRFFADT